MVLTLPDTQIERCRSLYDEFQADVPQVEFYKQLDQRRLVAKQEMIDFLNSYLTDEISSLQFKETFDRQMRKNWNYFGFKGMSGAMFLNKLVNHISDSDALTDQLRSALRVPTTVDNGQEQMRAFYQFIEGLISANQITRQQIQPARTPFFISIWWHLQSTELWPVFYPRTRQTLELDGLFVSSQDPINDYFIFRESYLSLAKALGLSSWNLEHLLAWQSQRTTNGTDTDENEQVPPVIIRTNAPSTDQQTLEDTKEVNAKEATAPLTKEEDEGQAASGHTHIQWLLAKIGQRLGCKVWIASNDQNRTWQGERLGDLSIKTLPPLWMDVEFQKTISLIDVLWLNSASGVVAAFEIEHTTSIYSGLLRMSDLVTSYPAINFPLYIVTPQARLDTVRHELSRPTFQALELHKRCGFFSEEQLLKESEHIMKWAASPSAIERLASRVGDVGG